MSEETMTGEAADGLPTKQDRDQRQDQDPKTLATVYQFGKVASASLVATLNELDNVEAAQSHFLGKTALHKIFGSVYAARAVGVFLQPSTRPVRRKRASDPAVGQHPRQAVQRFPGQ
ncbi:hypothetical protein ACFMBG_23570 [Leisingera sp. D0M16]|uniref:hypothetical protein n=1 Tax=Leisingera coralii TaxID=3351347 RepID=UPI003B824440